MSYHTATYSPDDNKLRLYPAHRLPADEYAQLKASGFSWAPKQELFVAPMWTPERANLLISMCGEIGDEDTSLIDRAEDRAYRFEDLSDKRLADAERAKNYVSSIADNIPFGQPILVGHHSEKHARKDAERIENGMKKAVKAFETAEYWTRRAAGAIRHAKYKERPDVRARRIKKIEADARKQEKSAAEYMAFLKLWTACKSHDDAFRIASVSWLSLNVVQGENGVNFTAYDVLRPEEERYRSCPSMTWEQVRGIAIARLTEYLAVSAQWAEHYANRLAYERAMLSDQGGIAADRTGPEKGGACKCWASPNGGWSYIQKVNKVSVTVLDNWGNGGGNFTRTIPLDKLTQLMTAQEVKDARDLGKIKETTDGTGFYLLQSREQFDADQAKQEAKQESNPPAEKTDFDAMKETLKQGVQVVSANQLFPTPLDLADRVAELADIQPGDAVLEPSAGTGRLIGAIGGRMFGHNPERGSVTAIEINPKLADHLRREFPLTNVKNCDFMECNGELGKFDKIIMNPPFENGSDIKHILHALTMLKTGGRLVAICADGPRQNEKLRPMIEEIGGTFEPLDVQFTGTNVRTALLVVDK